MDYIFALESFLKYLEANRGYSPLTIKEYRYDLLLFLRYLEKTKNTSRKNINPAQITKFDVGNFLADLILESNNSPVTRNRRLFSLRSFFQYLLIQEVVEQDPTQHLVASKVLSGSQPIYLQLPQARSFLQAIQEYGKKTKIRDIVIMKVFLYCGLRVGELVGLNVGNLELSISQSIKVLGKGQKERYIPLHPELINDLKNYLLWRNKIKTKTANDHSALFLSLHGRRINVRTVQLMVKKYAKMADIPQSDKITPHKLRHTFATLLYKETKDIRVLQELLGHESISTTQIYTHTDAEQRKKIVGKMPKL